jgi:hypothetical protein
VSPSPSPFSGSLLDALAELQATATSQLSLATAASETARIVWSGGQSVAGVAVTLVIAGGVVSTTVTATFAVSLPPLPSETTSVIVFLPSGNVTMGPTPLAEPNGPDHA